MSDIIRKADEIVGIDWRKLGISPCHDTKNTYRRGAYIEWLASQDRDARANAYRAFDLDPFRIGVMQTDELAQVVIRVHDAAKPKGDGLPDMQAVIYGSRNGACIEVIENGVCRAIRDEEVRPIIDYLDRCLSKPVRRLLAAFDVSDEPNKSNSAVWIKDGQPCYLEPREAKP